jgi:glycine/D-amino acid oxidase-like deaminating enzyme
LRVGIVGAGVFGIAAAIELAARGHDVHVFEQGDVPHYGASSTDVAKAVRRIWYAGDNETYVELVERAAPQWRAWEKQSGESFYHQTGAVTATNRLEAGSPMSSSVEFLRGRGDEILVMSPEEAGRRFPLLRFAADEVCVYDSWTGYVESGRAVRVMADMARDGGAQVRERTPARVIDERPSDVGIVHDDGRSVFDRVVVAAGPWVGSMLPELSAKVMVTRQEMLLIEPRDPKAFAHGVFPVWSFDPDGDGWYGFPLLREGWVKIAKDPPGEVVDPDVDRAGTGDFLEQAMAFLRERIPEMAAGRVVEGRTCLYTSTPDDHFMIDRVPGRERVFVAGGGSGHGFKFGGSIGPVIADAVEDRHNRLGERFRIGSRLDAGRDSEAVRGFASPLNPRSD